MSKRSGIVAIFLFSLLTQAHIFAVPLFTLEGTTGAGKSTLLKLLAQEIPNIVPVFEPVDQIQDVGGHGNLLDLYYHDKERWTYLFQTFAFFLQDELNTQTALTISDDKVIIGDRSIFSTYYVFGKMLNESNVFNSIEWHIYKNWFNYAVKRSIMLPQGFIYLRTTPDVCFERIKKRNRIEEQEAVMEFYAQEYMFHEKWLIERADIEHQYLQDVPVLILDGNQDFLHDENVRKQMVAEIRAFIESLRNNKK